MTSTSTAATEVRSPVVRTFMELAAVPSPAREEGPAAAFVRSYLETLGLEVHEDDAGAAIPAGCNNLLVRLAPTAPGTPIFMCLHLDTVALEDEVVPIITDEGHVTNERRAILGSDNKAAVAVMLELVRELVETGAPHAGLEVVFTPCEEVGLLGAKHFDVAQLDARFGYVFDHGNDIGKIVARAPSQISLTMTFTGQASHSGIAPDEGRSAILAAAQALCSMRLGRIDDESTANVGLIEGGTAVNIVPERCTLRGEARSLVHENVTTIAQQLVDSCTDAAAAHGVDVDIDMREEYRAYGFREQSPPVRLAAEALRACGYEPELIDCGGGSDGNVFNAAGKPCVNLCNGMRRIHTPDEYITVEDLDGMMRVARQLVTCARDGD